MGKFFDELKRRNVFRVAVAYAIVGWVVIQITDIAVPALRLPEWVPALVFYLGLVGFPFALILSWAFELTPEGVKKTADVEASESITPATGQKLNYFITAGLVLTVGYLLYQQGGTTPAPDRPQTTAGVTAVTSIAVLPFSDMSPGGDQEYFSDGISEELLNVLASIPQFRVAARTSSFQFKGQNPDIIEIGRQLNVDHILEGSVRSSGTQVRITAQLIDTRTGFHLWSQTYNRQMEDIFAIQDEISAAIVEALAAKLGIAVDAAQTKSVSVDTAAFDHYLAARQLYVTEPEDWMREAAEHLRMALEIEPGYAAVHGLMAALYTDFELRSLLGISESAANLRAERHADTALALNPDLAQAFSVKAGLAWTRGDELLALSLFDRSIAINPNQSRVQTNRSILLFDVLNRFSEAIDANEIAVAIDPLDHSTRADLAITLILAGHLDRARPHLEQLRSSHPYGYLRVSHWAALRAGRSLDALKLTLGGLETVVDEGVIQRHLPLMVAAGLERVAIAAAAGNEAIALAEFYLEMQEFEQGISELDAKIQQNPDVASLRLGRAVLQIYNGQYAVGARTLDQFWQEQEGRITIFGLVNRISASALYSARRALGDSDGAAEVYKALIEFQELLDRENVEDNPFHWHVAAARIIAGDDQGFTDLLQMARDGNVYGPKDVHALRPFANDPRMLEIKNLVGENRARLRRDIRAWLCADVPPVENLSLRIETCG